MRASEWPYQIGFALLTFLLFTFLPDYRLLFLITLPFLFGYFIARDEYRTGRATIMALLPVFMGIVALFFITFLRVAFNPNSLSLARSLVAPAAAGFLVMLVLGAVIGFPLAWVGFRLRRPQVVQQVASA